MNQLDQMLTSIAREHLGVTTLESRQSDRLDFHELPVWGIYAALTAANDFGARSAETASDPALAIRFDGYEIHGVKEYDDPQGKYCEQVPDDEADVWGLYGHISGQGLDCIGDFETREQAEEVFARITKRSYTETTRQASRQEP